ncbi:hypothetical protein Trydic_g2329 [Trypoxylus dichotomus]
MRKKRKKFTPSEERPVRSSGHRLKFGPQFLEKIVCGVENTISTLETNTAETIRQEACTILNNTRPPKKNLNIEELKALVEVRRNENIIIFPTDRGNGTVVLNTRDYKDKMQKLREDPTYKPITTDPITYLEKTTHH